MIPEQLKDDEYLLKIHSPEADCNHPGKQPVGSAETGPFYTSSDPELENHIQDGGNVGKALKGPLVVFDVDHEEFASELSSKLPPTFVVESGGSGFGQHWYYHCPEWAENRQFKVQGTDYGSLRTGNWQVVIPPSIHPESGNEYQVDSDRLISSVGIHEIENLISGISGIRTANTTGGGGGGPAAAAGGVGGEIPELPEKYPEKPGDWQTAKRWLASNRLLDRLNCTTSNDWSGLEFSIAKCLAEGGFKETVISGVLDRLHSSAKWHRRGDDYRKRTVRKAVVAACDDKYVDFSSGDMEASDASESRKTEESGNGRTLSGGEHQMDYDDKKTLTAYQANSPEEAEDGNRVVRVQLTNMNGTGDDGEHVDVDLVSVQKGILRENGDFGVSPEFNGDTKRLGAADPEDLRLMADGLDQLADEIDG